MQHVLVVLQYEKSSSYSILFHPLDVGCPGRDARDGRPVRPLHTTVLTIL